MLVMQLLLGIVIGLVLQSFFNRWRPARRRHRVHQQGMSLPRWGSKVWSLQARQDNPCQAEQTLQRIFQNSPLLVCIVQLEADRFMEVNRTFLEKTGYACEEVEGKTNTEIPIFKESIWDIYQAFLEYDHYLDYEIVLQTKEGLDIRGLFSAEVLDFQGHPHLLIMMQDITAQQRVQKALVESEYRYRTLFECAQIAIFCLHEGRFVDCNRAAVEMFGCERENFWDKTPMDFSPPWQSGGQSSANRIETLIAQALAGQNQRFEWKFQRPDGQLFDVDISLNRLDLPGQILLLAFVQDISQQKQREAEIRNHQIRLRSLANALSVTEEQIRKRVATFLHDQICQGLISCKLMLDAECRNQDIESTETSLSKISESIAEIAEQTQGLTVDLASPTLYRLGLAAAVLEWLRDQVEAKHGIMTYFESEGDPQSTDEECLAFAYRAIKELGFNVIKHAQAQNLWVTLEVQSDTLLIVVTDDGIGFDMATMRSSNELGTGLGLLSIRERLDFIGGRFKINSAVGQGTTIEMSIPASIRNVSAMT